MFTLTSTSTKVAVFALSVGVTLSAFNGVVRSFEPTALPNATFELPTVIVIGHRAEVVADTLQAKAKANSDTGS